MQPVRVLAGLFYLHRAWKQHSGSASLGMGHSNQATVWRSSKLHCQCRGSTCAVPPLPELAQLAQSCLPLPCWLWIAFFYSVFLLSGHWSPNQARRQSGPICPLCCSITLASSLSSVCSLPACSSCPFPLLLLLASEGQSSLGTTTEAWLKSQWQLLVSCWLCYVLLWLIRLLDLIFLSHSVLLRVYSSFALLIASIILLCYLKSTLEEFGFFPP